MNNKSPFIFIAFAVLVIAVIAIVSLRREISPPQPGGEENPVKEKEPPKIPVKPTPTNEGEKEPDPTPRQKQSQTGQNQVEIKVTNQQRVPLENAIAEIYPYTDTILPIRYSPLFYGETDAVGRAGLGENLAGAYVLKVAAPGFADELKRITLSEAILQKEITILMKPEQKISGTVKNEKGKALSGVEIGPLFLESMAEQKSVFIPEFTKTDEKGAFTFKGLKSLSYKLQSTVPGYQPRVLEQIKAPQGNLEIILKPGGAQVTGITAGSKDGQPKKDVGVLLAEEGVLLYTVSKEKGVFAFQNIPAGKHYVEPYLEGEKAGRPVPFECNGKDPVKDIVLKVHQGVRISGKVIEEVTKIPLQGVALEVKEGEGKKTVTTDDNGDFRFPPLFPEKGIDILIGSAKFYYKDEDGILKKVFPVEGYMPENDITDLIIPMETEYNLKGEAENIAEEDAKKYRVKIEPLEKESKRKTVWAKLEKNLSFKTKYMGSGRNVAGLIDEKGGLASEPVEFQLSPHTQPPVIKLKAGAPNTLKGSVLEHTGNPLPGAKIKAQGKMTTLDAVTDEKGKFSLETNEKKLSLEVSSSQYTQTLKREINLPMDEEITFRFILGSDLRGMVVTNDDIPVAFARISYFWLNSNTGENIRKQITTDKEGRFKITDVIGNLIDRLVCEGPTRGELAKTGKFGKAELRDIHLPREELKIVLPRAINLRLHLLDENNSPYSGHLSIEIQTWKQERNIYELLKHETKIAQQGTCVVSSLNPGTYAVRIKTTDGYSGFEDSVVVDDSSEESEATIFLHKAEIIYGYVYDETSQNPLNGVNIIFKFSEGFNVQHGTTTNNEGFFEMKKLPDGMLTIQFGKTGYIFQSESVTITDGISDVSSPLEIYMQSAEGSVHGIVLNSENKPEASVNVVIRKIDVEEEALAVSRSNVTGNDGAFYFDKLGQGEYMVIADKGESSETQLVILQSREKKEITIELKSKVLVKGALETSQQKLYEQPLLFSNIYTQKNYLCPLNSSHEFEIYLPAGEYKIHIGDSEISGDLTIPEGMDVYELDLSF